jgi:hypothetical protein
VRQRRPRLEQRERRREDLEHRPGQSSSYVDAGLCLSARRRLTNKLHAFDGASGRVVGLLAVTGGVGAWYARYDEKRRGVCAA